MNFGTLPSFRNKPSWVNVSAREMQSLVDTVKALANPTVGPGLSIRFNRSGIHYDVRKQKKPKRGAEPTAIRFGIITEATNDDSRFVQVRAVKRDNSDPDTWGYEYDGDAGPVACYPGLRAKNYRAFVWGGEAPDLPASRVLPVWKIESDWYVLQHTLFEMRDVSGLQISDCQLPE